jgi:hypothetical protein
LDGPWLDVQFGVGGGGDPQKYPLATLGRSTLNDKVSSMTKVFDFGTRDWSDVQFPASGQRYPIPLETGVQTLQQIVDSNPELGSGSNISTIPYLGNRAIIGNNISNNETVLVNSKLTETSIGNSAIASSNVELNSTVQNYSSRKNPQISNQAQPSRNLSLQNYTKYSNSKVFGTVDWNSIQFPNSAQKFPPPTTEN